MKPNFVALLLIAVTIGVQRVFAIPQAPAWSVAILLPMPWVVGPPLLSDNRRWYAVAFALGLMWDAMFEPVIGPGAIAWSAAAAMVWSLAGVVVNRGPRMWFIFGVVATLAYWAARWISLAILGLYLTPRPSSLLFSSLFSALLCGCVGWLFWYDIPRHWRSLRARRLR